MKDQDHYVSYRVTRSEIANRAFNNNEEIGIKLTASPTEVDKDEPQRQIIVTLPFGHPVASTGVGNTFELDLRVPQIDLSLVTRPEPGDGGVSRSMRTA